MHTESLASPSLAHPATARLAAVMAMLRQEAGQPKVASPIADDHPATSPDPTQPETAAEDPVVLVAEDNKINQKILFAFLKKKKGIPVHMTANGVDAVDAYKNTIPRFKVALIDIHMPLMDGFTAAREIRKFEQENNLSRSRIIGLSATASASLREQATESGMDDLLIRVWTFSELWQLMRPLIDAAAT